MVKLSLSAIVIRSNIERGNTLLTICDRLVQQKMIDSSKCFDKLKRKA